MIKNLHESYISHITRYVGIGLISGSVVHAGTLGGSSTKYIVLILMGIVMFAIGTLIEHKNEKLKELLGYLFISVIVSIGTGMVSGATQHYVDKPSVGAILLSVGLLVSYISFTWRDYSAQLNTKRVIVAILAAVVLWFGLGIINSILPEREHAVDHHSIN